MNEIFLNVFFSISTILFTIALAFYIITCFQWFSYKFKRVIFHFTKPLWHIAFVILPIVLFYTTGVWFFIYFYFAYLVAIFIWYKKLDKKLVFTPRIKRFFAFLFIAVFAQNLFSILNGYFSKDVISPIVISLVISHFFEKYSAFKFRKMADNKLKNLSNLKIILITASYGKTSIKNFLYDILKDNFICHKTPRSVNTLVGLIKDVNDNLNDKTQIYIAEAGARLSGDIAEISAFLNPHIVIVGEIGAQHIEYFKSIENIRATKLEALLSKRLQMAFLHSLTLKEPSEKLVIYDNGLEDIDSDLDGLSFSLDGDKFLTPLLGKFNAGNLAACIRVARYLGVGDDKIKKSLHDLKNVEHRLERMDAGGKIIIDDSFNGNFVGMSASYELINTYKGRKVLITPGIVESTDEDNEKLSRIIDTIFDIVMITSPLNAKALLKYLNRPQVIIIKDKTKMTEILAQNTKSGDIILFSNDAPSFM